MGSRAYNRAYRVWGLGLGAYRVWLHFTATVRFLPLGCPSHGTIEERIPIVCRVYLKDRRAEQAVCIGRRGLINVLLGLPIALFIALQNPLTPPPHVSRHEADVCI